jgi:acetyl-CoA acetyltransferase family protein
MTDIVILEGARTPFGTLGGGLKDTSPVDLAEVAGREALRRAAVSPQDIDQVVLGMVIAWAAEAPYFARHTALRLGIPQQAPALHVSRLCGSGLQAIISGAQVILTEDASFVLAGGAENMSGAPFLSRSRWGLPLGNATLEDALWGALFDPYTQIPMAITAENLARRYGISREEQDAFAYRSQMQTKRAQEQGWLSEEIVPVQLPGRRGAVIFFDRDEHPRPGVTLPDLARLPARFQEGGTVTPGNASGINDGAAVLLMASGGAAEERGLRPLGRLVSWASVGVDPSIMGIGPAPALRLALKRAGLSLAHMDRIEINEAFAAQYLAVEKELGLDRDKVNVNGGAIALGHPIGASGARLALTLLYQLRRDGLRYGAAALCIGGGQGIAAVFENPAAA